VSPTPLRPATRTVNRQYSGLPPQTIDVSAEYTATIHTNMGSIMVELFPGQAPVTVNNFVFLAMDRFYDGLIFHRVIEDFMVQGGDPSGSGSGGPGYLFHDEISPGLVFDAPGKLAMANSGAGTGTNGSQFFITTVPTPHLDGSHTIFGQVTSGQDVVDSISRVSANAADRPQQPVIIEGIDVRSASR
jgi:cyclophilin family peptidyl-prolyl cis-trans isomerase